MKVWVEFEQSDPRNKVLAWSGDVLGQHGKEPGQLELGTNLQAPTSQSSGPPGDSQERVSLLELRVPQLDWPGATFRPRLWQKTDSIPESEKPFQRRLMEIYAGFTEHADYNVGRVLDEIDALGYGDNTLTTAGPWHPRSQSLAMLYSSLLLRSGLSQVR